MAETATVGELLVRLRADMTQLESGLQRAQGTITTFSTGSVVGVGRLERAFATLAFTAAGVSPVLGHIPLILSQLLVGGPVVLGVLAGIAAIGGALLLLESRAKAQEAEWKEMAEDFKGAAAHGAALDKILDKILKPDRIAELRLQIAHLRENLSQARGVGEATGVGGIFFPTPGDTGIGGAATMERVQRILQAINRLQKELNDLLREQRTRIAEDETALQKYVESWEAWDRQGRKFLDEQANKDILGAFGFRPEQLKDIGNALKHVTSDLDFWGREATKTMHLIGQHLGTALIEGMNSVLSGGGIGGFFKHLFRTLLDFGLQLAVRAGVTAAFGPGGAVVDPAFPGLASAPSRQGLVGTAVTRSLDFSNFPAAQNPLAAARDRDWQRFLRESVLSAQRSGFAFG